MFNSNTNRLNMTITFVRLTVALSMIKFEIGHVHVGFSSLLVCMMLGTIFCNVCDFSANLMEKTDRWTAPLFILFFVLSGAELEIKTDEAEQSQFEICVGFTNRSENSAELQKKLLLLTRVLTAKLLHLL